MADQLRAQRSGLLPVLPSIKSFLVEDSDVYDLWIPKKNENPIRLPAIDALSAERLDFAGVTSSRLLLLKQVRKKVIEWFKNWRPWQQRILLCGLAERCTKAQIHTLITALEPVFHKDFLSELSGTYTVSVKEKKKAKTVEARLPSRPPSPDRVPSFPDQTIVLPNDPNHRHTPYLKKSASLSKFFPDYDDRTFQKLGKMTNRVKPKDHIIEQYGYPQDACKPEKWWSPSVTEGHQLTRARGSKLSLFYHTQLAEIWKIMNEWAEYERVELISDVIKCCDPPQLGFFAQCLSRKKRDTKGLASLPDQTILKIFGYLDAASLGKSAQICRRFRFLSDHNDLWKNLCANLGNIEAIPGLTCVIQDKNEKYIFWKQAYFEVREYYKKLEAQQRKKEDRGGAVDINLFMRKNGDEFNEEDLVTDDEFMQDAVEKQSVYSEAEVASTADMDSRIKTAALDVPLGEPRPSTSTEPEPLGDGKDLTGGNLQMLAKSLKALTGVDPQKEQDQAEIAFDVRPQMVQPHDAKKGTKKIDPADLKVYAVKNPASVKRVRKLQGHMDAVLCLQFDSRRLFTGSLDRTIRAWDVRSGTGIRKMKGHKGGVRCLYFIEDLMVSGSWDMTIMVWNIVKFERITVLYGHKGCISGLGFCEETNTLVSGSHDRTIRIWDMDTWTCRRVIEAHNAEINCLLFDGIYIITGSSDRTVKFWDSRADVGEELVQRLGNHDDSVECVTVQSSLLISGCSDGLIYCWDIMGGTIEATIQAHRGPVHSVYFHNLQFFTAGADNLVKEWDTSTGVCLRSLQGHRGPVNAVKVFAQRIVSCSDDGSVRIWDMRSPATRVGVVGESAKLDNTIEPRVFRRDESLMPMAVSSSISRFRLAAVQEWKSRGSKDDVET